MRDIWKIAQWEIMRNLRNKQFIIGLLLTPLIIAVFSGAPRLLERWNQPATSTYYVLDEIGAVDLLADTLMEATVELREFTDDPEALVSAVLVDDADGYFILGESFLQTGQLEIGFNRRNNEAFQILSYGLTRLLQSHRINEAGMTPTQLAYLTAEAVVIPTAMEEAAVRGGEGVAVAIAFAGILFFLVFSSGAMLMQSALQERRDRMAEVVLSSVSPTQLMQGKIIGHFLLGLIQLTVWMILGLPAVIFLLEFPVWEALGSVNLPLIALFAVLGYLLFSALFVSMGATMEDLQSAGNAQGLVIMIPMLSILFAGPVIANPDGVISQFASMFPITSPAIMIVRSEITNVPLWQILVSLTLLAAATWIIVHLAAKIFRVGMLMYGKTASMAEIMKWIGYKER